jgi:hypothetical protein
MTGFVPNAGQPQPTAGASIGGAVGAAVGGMLSEAAIASTAAGVQKLADAAKSGGFAISEDGADEYIRVFRGFEDVGGDLLREADAAGQAPQLGGSDYAAQVARHTQLVATGDAHSYGTALRSLLKIVGQAREAFEQAKKNYRQMDDQAAQTFGGAQV